MFTDIQDIDSNNDTIPFIFKYDNRQSNTEILLRATIYKLQLKYFGKNFQNHSAFFKEDIAFLKQLLDRTFWTHQECIEVYFKLTRYRNEIIKAGSDLDVIDPPLTGVFIMNRTPNGNIIHVNYSEFVRVINERFHTLTFNNRLFIYENGIYRENANDVENFALQLLEDERYIHSKSTIFKNLISELKATNPTHIFPFNTAEDMIPVKNGILKFDYDQKKVQCLPFSPEFKFSYRFDVTYDPDIFGDEMQLLLSQFVSCEDLVYLYQIPAQALLQMQGKTFKKAYFIQGEKNAGKTTYFRILYRLFGELSISKIPLQQLTPECRFSIAALEGKIFNLYDDLSTIKLNTAGVFKTLTGDIFHQIERKNKDIYQGRITALHVFNCNRLPEITDEVLTDHAFWERIEIVRFPNQFAVAPNFIEDTITDKLMSGFLNEIIEHMFKIHDKNGLIKKTDYLEVQKEWFKIDHFARFIEDLFSNEKTSEENFYLKDPIFSLYKHWCDQRNIPDRERIVSKNTFTDKLKMHGIKPDQKRYGDGRKYVYSSYYQIRGEYYPIYLMFVENSTDKDKESLKGFL